MRLKSACLVLGAILLAQGDARPQEIGTNEPAISEVEKKAKGFVDDKRNEDLRSRYRSSTLGSRSIKKIYNKLNHSGPGIISSIGKSRHFKLPRNWTLYSPSDAPESPNYERTELGANLRGFRNGMNYRHAARISSVDDGLVSNTNSGTRNSGRSTTAKLPTVVKNLVVIRSGKYPSPIASYSNKIINVPAIKKSSESNDLKQVTIQNNFSKIRKPEYFNQHLKNWPNDRLRGFQDFINHEEYATVTEKVLKKPLPVLSRKPSKANISIHQKRPEIHDSIYPDPMSQPNVQKIIEWFQIPLFTSSNSPSRVIQKFQPSEFFSNPINPGFEPNLPMTTVKNFPSTLINDEYLNDFIFPGENNHHHHEAVLSTKIPINTDGKQIFPTAYSVIDVPIDISISGKPSRLPIFRPFSEVSQNVAVHITNPFSKKTNVSVSEEQTTQTNVLTSEPPSHVHIMFMPPEDGNKESYENTISQQLPFNKYSDCPTITINSITKVNNTLSSKEGCTDLNIVINSQVLNTNNFGTGITGSDEDGQDKYSDVKDEYSNSQDDDNTSNTGTSSSSLEYVSPDSDMNNIFDGFDKELSDSDNDDVNQENEVHYEETGLPEGEVSEANDALGSEITNPPAEDSSDISNDTVGASPSGGAIPGSPEVGEAVGQSNDAIVLSSAGQVSSISNLPTLENHGSGSGGDEGGESTALTTIDEDDDDDEIFYLTPSGVMESMTSVFAYFTFLNPLNYGIFSLAAAPFAALAAGILGVAALFFPWAFTSGFGFARAADKVTIKFRPNLEEVVKKSIHDYRSLQEWESKRKKSKRR